MGEREEGRRESLKILLFEFDVFRGSDRHSGSNFNVIKDKMLVIETIFQQSPSLKSPTRKSHCKQIYLLNEVFYFALQPPPLELDGHQLIGTHFRTVRGVCQFLLNEKIEKL